MAYSKTTWQNNVTDIDENNLNKIEQGIYDNSLVVDAIKNKLNPTDTETYKTAELTEGQITDVIGVSDILIKGQTEQDGTPTPSAPVDVNVVSGSNVINTSSKNLFDKDTEIKGKLIVTTTGAIQNNSAWNISQFIPVKSGTELCFSYQTQGRGQIELIEYDKNQNILGGEAPSITQKYTKTISNNTKFVRVGYRNDLTCDNLQLEYGSNRTTYEPHQGKELPLDLPVENLFVEFSFTDKTQNGLKVSRNSNNTLLIKGISTAIVNNWIDNLNISLSAGTYTFSTNYDLGSKITIVLKDNNSQNLVQFNSGKSATFSITETTVFNQMLIQVASGVTIDNNFSFQLEQGSKANAYTPYGTDPIELCKIGNYQDYFYKSGSKWYLHKEIKKTIFNGNSSEVWTLNSSGTYYKYQWSYALPDKYNVANTPISCNYFQQITVSEGDTKKKIGIVNGLYPGYSIAIICEITTLNDFKTWLASNNVFVYYPLETAIDTEITDTTLISQLEAIYNAPLYEETNITQTNNDLPMILDITACKDNINGIKAFIRK